MAAGPPGRGPASWEQEGWSLALYDSGWDGSRGFCILLCPAWFEFRVPGGFAFEWGRAASRLEEEPGPTSAGRPSTWPPQSGGV